MQQDCQRRSVGGQNDDLRDTSVEGFGCFVGAFLQLAVVGSLLHNVEDLLGEGSIGKGPGWRRSVLWKTINSYLHLPAEVF